MKFLVISDLHQKVSALKWINDVISEEKPDHVLFLGDITEFGTGEEAADIIRSINGDVYAIPGNCDPLDLPDKISAAAKSVHGKADNIGGCDFAFLGGSNITIFDTPFELSEDDIYNALKPISKAGMVLVTHAPSFGTLDHIPNGASVGSPAIKRIIDEFKPMAALSGHIHEDRGAVRKDGVLYLNPGPAKDGYCAIFSIEGGFADARLLGPHG
ncbi:MAG: metallophosphoesterase family protein [Candidatus Methanoplasma sp.]|jgi:Icc-related predicted phosphoesterase|nr:metallophosphoesterase family protein [Candidatus Methanoplasma sp.]